MTGCTSRASLRFGESFPWTYHARMFLNSELNREEMWRHPHFMDSAEIIRYNFVSETQSSELFIDEIVG